MDLFQDVRHNPYPGRGIVLALSMDGGHAVIAYFIMGRSTNSRNRVFIERNGDIVTEAFDPAKLTDPTLIIYTPMRVCADGITVVTNGDQTDTVAEYLECGKSFEEALRTRTFEPDAPNFTPRISGMLEVRKGHVRYKLAILKSCGGDAESLQRFFFEYPTPRRGEGHFLHTYVTDGDPLHSYEGEPKRVTVAGTLEAFADELWENLNEDNRVSLFVRFIDLKNGDTRTRILNRHS